MPPKEKFNPEEERIDEFKEYVLRPAIDRILLQSSQREISLSTAQLIAGTLKYITSIEEVLRLVTDILTENQDSINYDLATRTISIEKQESPLVFVLTAQPFADENQKLITEFEFTDEDMIRISRNLELQQWFFSEIEEQFDVDRHMIAEIMSVDSTTVSNYVRGKYGFPRKQFEPIRNLLNTLIKRSQSKK